MTESRSPARMGSIRRLSSRAAGASGRVSVRRGFPRTIRPSKRCGRRLAPDGRRASSNSAPAADPETKRRLDRRARRTTAAAIRDASFDWLAEGFTHQEIAAVRKVSVAVVRRDIARAIRARQIETRDGHAQLQIARLTKGLALVTHRIESATWPRSDRW